MDFKTAKEFIEKDGKATVLDEDQMLAAQEIVTAIGGIPQVWLQISAWLRARGFDDPDVNMRDLKDALF